MERIRCATATDHSAQLLLDEAGMREGFSFLKPSFLGFVWLLADSLCSISCLRLPSRPTHAGCVLDLHVSLFPCGLVSLSPVEAPTILQQRPPAPLPRGMCVEVMSGWLLGVKLSWFSCSRSSSSTPSLSLVQLPALQHTAVFVVVHGLSTMLPATTTKS